MCYKVETDEFQAFYLLEAKAEDSWIRENVRYAKANWFISPEAEPKKRNPTEMIYARVDSRKFWHGSRNMRQGRVEKPNQGVK